MVNPGFLTCGQWLNDLCLDRDNRRNRMIKFTHESFNTNMPINAGERRGLSYSELQKLRANHYFEDIIYLILRMDTSNFSVYRKLRQLLNAFPLYFQFS